MSEAEDEDEAFEDEEPAKHAKFALFSRKKNALPEEDEGEDETEDDADFAAPEEEAPKDNSQLSELEDLFASMSAPKTPAQSPAEDSFFGEDAPETDAEEEDEEETIEDKLRNFDPDDLRTAFIDLWPLNEAPAPSPYARPAAKTPAQVPFARPAEPVSATDVTTIAEGLDTPILSRRARRQMAQANDRASTFKNMLDDTRMD
jgi:hypothetical protein